MALRVDDFDFLANFSTLWQVVLGATLATLGGFAATQMERMVQRRERARSAALLMGEVLATVDVLAELAAEARGRGQPYGPVTMRMLGSLRREIDLYERNRERLSDVEDGQLRARVHTVIVRLALSLEGIFDTSRELDAQHARAAAAGGHPDADELSRLETLREQSFEFLLETAAQITPMLARFGALAGHSFSDMGRIAREF